MPYERLMFPFKVSLRPARAYRKVTMQKESQKLPSHCALFKGPSKVGKIVCWHSRRIVNMRSIACSGHLRILLFLTPQRLYGIGEEPVISSSMCEHGKGSSCSTGFKLTFVGFRHKGLVVDESL
jgi:hypothetical protein